MIVAFVGVHGPLLFLVGWVVANRGVYSTATAVLAVLLGTLAATAMTLSVIGTLLSPVLLATRALENYTTTRRVTTLPSDYTDEAGRLMSAANQMVEKLESSIHELESLSMTDALTGAFNRRFAEERLFKDSQTGHPLSLLVIDLDDFKAINDTAGHGEGDRVLREAMGVIQGRIRETDWCARWGGDEFIVAIRGDLTVAREIGGRIRRSFDFIRIEALNRSLSASIGIAELGPEDNSVTLFQKADEAAYHSKRSAKGTVSVYSVH